MEKKYLSKDKLVGKQVIDSSAMIIGTVKDMTFDFEARDIGITITAKTGGEIVVPGSNVSNIGDVILLNKKIELPEAAPTATPQSTYSPPPVKEAVASTTIGLCRNCNYQNDATAKFCIKCGSKLQ